VKAVPLVELRHPLLGTQADPGMAFLPGLLKQRGHQLAAEPSAATARDDGDRQLGRLLVDEAETRSRGREEAVPRSSDRTRLPRHEPGVARTTPVVHVPGDRLVGILVETPVVGVLEHVAEEADVLWPGLADHVSESKRDSLERVILCEPRKKVPRPASPRL
jgi:hypothetical protein